MGTKSRDETLETAEELEREHAESRRGHRDPPEPALRHRKRSFADVMEEYLAWGAAQGGRGGKPWGEWHLHHRRRHLTWWEDRLDLETMADLDELLPRVENEIRKLLAANYAGKTIANTVESISAFCRWSLKRKYLPADPLDGIAPVDTTPRKRRRSMHGDELKRLLAVCAPHRRLVWEVACLSGLRTKELRNLRVRHLDVERGGLYLDAVWTKNRKPGFQVLPRELVDRLVASAKSGEVVRLNARFYNRKDAKRVPTNDALLYVPSGMARDLRMDLKEADIPVETEEGGIDFHAVRVAFTNLIRERGGADPKEAQELARHQSVDQTFNTYGRVQSERLREVIETSAVSIAPEAERALSVQKTITVEKEEGPTANGDKQLRLFKMVELRGIEPLTS